MLQSSFTSEAAASSGSYVGHQNLTLLHATGIEDEGRVCETHASPESAQELLPHSLVSLKVSVTSHECVEKVTRPGGT